MKKYLVISILAFSLLVTGCGKKESSTQSQSGANMKPSGVFEEGPCPFDEPRGEEVVCGFVIVPEDHNNPDGPTIKLSLAIIKDESDDHLSDPLILLAGGPGENVMESGAAIWQMLEPVLGNRDLIIFDQRGAGLSEPSLECPEVVDNFFDNLNEPDVNVSSQEGFEALKDCHDRLVSEGYNLSVFNTLQNAADVEAIRLALDYDEVNLYGGSYGSILAQAVMRDYPDGLRSVILESVLPLEVNFYVELTTTIPDAIMSLIDNCADDSSCSAVYPDLENVFIEVIDRLNAEPVLIEVTNPYDGEQHEVLLSGDTVLSNLTVVLYITPTIPSVPQAIYDVYNEDFNLMTELTSLNFVFIDAVSRGMQFSVMCTDDLIGADEEDILDAMDTLPSQFVGDGEEELFLKYGIFDICEFWSVEEAEPWVKEPLVSDIPTLVLSGELDPVTPPKFGELVAKNLSNSYFYVFPGGGHTGETTSDCALDITAAFVNDPETEPDASCIEEMPGLVFDIPGESDPIAFEPILDEETGISGIIPAGWTEAAPFTYARAKSPLDVTMIQFAVNPVMTSEDLLEILVNQLGLAETPEVVSERLANGLLWSLYAVEIQGYPANLAIADSEIGVILVLMLSAENQQAELYETVFLPVVDGLVPSE